MKPVFALLGLAVVLGASPVARSEQLLAPDHLTRMDEVQISEPSTQMEWLFNMGLVSGLNDRGELRHFAVVVNTLIGPRLRKLGPIPYPEFQNKPLVLVTIHDLDR
jgi:hypothetical protein